MSIEQTVERELGEFRVRNPIWENRPDWEIKNGFMNNFYIHFANWELGYRQIYKEHRWDKTYRDYLIELGLSEQTDSDFQTYSLLYLSQTGRQFFEAVDQAVLEAGVDKTHLETMATKFNKLSEDERRQFLEILFPVYLKLREKGYNHRDLIT